MAENVGMAQCPSNGLDQNREDSSNTPSVPSSEVYKAPLKRPASLASDEESRKRGRRMLGLVLGTLQKFRSTEKADTAADKQRQVQARLSERLQEERLVLAESLERERQERREKRERLRAAWKAKEDAEAERRKQEHTLALSRFLKTEDSTVHSVLYMPAKMSAEQLEKVNRQMSEAGLDPEAMQVDLAEEQPMRRLDFDLDHDSYDDMSTDDEYEKI